MAKRSLKELFMKFVSVVPNGDNPPAKIVLMKNKDEDKNKGGVQMKKLEEILKGMEKEDVKVIKDEIDKIEVVEKAKSDIEGKFKDLEKAKGELESKVKELEKVKPAEETDEELIKSADPKIQEMLKNKKAVEDENEKLKKEKEDGEKELRKVELKKEAEEYPNLGSPVEDIVEIFSKLDGDEKTTELVKGIFGATNKALEGTNLLKSVGTDKDSDQKTPEEELNEKAEAMVEKDGITIELAKTKIMKSNPDKYMK